MRRTESPGVKAVRLAKGRYDAALEKYNARLQQWEKVAKEARSLFEQIAGELSGFVEVEDLTKDGGALVLRVGYSGKPQASLRLCPDKASGFVALQQDGFTGETNAAFVDPHLLSADQLVAHLDRFLHHATAGLFRHR